LAEKRVVTPLGQQRLQFLRKQFDCIELSEVKHQIGRTFFSALKALKGTDNCLDTWLLENFNKFVGLDHLLLCLPEHGWGNGTFLTLDPTGGLGAPIYACENCALLSGLAELTSSAIGVKLVLQGAFVDCFSLCFTDLR